MGKSEVKLILDQYWKLDFEKTVLEKQILLEGKTESLKQRISEAYQMLDALERCLISLNKDEKFVIRYHIFKNLKWQEVMQSYETEFGKENGKSERTLKRLQARAIEKIAYLMNSTNTEAFLLRHASQQIKIT